MTFVEDVEKGVLYGPWNPPVPFTCAPTAIIPEYSEERLELGRSRANSAFRRPSRPATWRLRCLQE